uniref:Secreted protein n=1 Tax=Steinernema glaseri TaxID=37863 RepID=A0A1I7YK94_9BILA
MGRVVSHMGTFSHLLHLSISVLDDGTAQVGDSSRLPLSTTPLAAESPLRRDVYRLNIWNDHYTFITLHIEASLFLYSLFVSDLWERLTVHVFECLLPSKS